MDENVTPNNNIIDDIPIIPFNDEIPPSNNIDDIPGADLTPQDKLLNDSRITPTGNGNPDTPPTCTKPTSGQKWWAAVLLGFVFGIISSPAAYYVTSSVSEYLGGGTLMVGPGPNFVGLLTHSIIFILVIRLILW